jgi:hypothetical protein
LGKGRAKTQPLKKVEPKQPTTFWEKVEPKTTNYLLGKGRAKTTFKKG